MTFDEYLYICELALNKDNLRNFDIIELSLLAVTNCWLALQYVKLKNMTFDEYYQICKSAIENNVSALQYVDKNVSKDEYYDICYFAVITNPLAFQYVDKEIIPEKYYDICKLALQYLDSDRYEITIEEIYKICELAVKYDSSLINFVPKEKILSSQLVNLLKIGNNSIVSARLGRTPVQAIIQGLLKTVANVPYDDLFHLFIELTLDNGQKWVLEKIERINLVKENRSNKKGAEFTS